MTMLASQHKPLQDLGNCRQVRHRLYSSSPAMNFLARASSVNTRARSRQQNIPDCMDRLASVVMTGASAAYTVAHGAVLAVDSSCQTSSTVTASTDQSSVVGDEVYTANTWRDDDAA